MAVREDTVRDVVHAFNGIGLAALDAPESVANAYDAWKPTTPTRRNYPPGQRIESAH